MRAGRLRGFITIMRKVTAKVEGEIQYDNFGEEIPETGDGVIDGWEPLYKNVRSGKEPLSGSEYYKFDQKQTEATVRFPLRYLPGITAEMRVLSDGVQYEITAPPIDVDNRHRELILMCKEVSHAVG